MWKPGIDSREYYNDISGGGLLNGEGDPLSVKGSRFRVGSKQAPIKIACIKEIPLTSIKVIEESKRQENSKGNLDDLKEMGIIKDSEYRHNPFK